MVLDQEELRPLKASVAFQLAPTDCPFTSPIAVVSLKSSALDRQPRPDINLPHIEVVNTTTPSS